MNSTRSFAYLGISEQDELAIRRAVWSRFCRSGMRSAPCPYPDWHPHRAIWADELFHIASEFQDQIVPPAPAAEFIPAEETIPFPIPPAPEPEDLPTAANREGRVIYFGLEEVVI